MKLKNHFLSPKDRNLLTFLLKNKVSTSKMMRKYCFTDIQRSTMDKRLRKLQKSQHIDRVYIVNEEQRSNRCFFLSRKGLSEFTSKSISFKDLKIKSEVIYHDLTLVDIRYKLEIFPNVIEVYSENDLILNLQTQRDPQFKDFREMRSDSALKLKWKGEELFVALEYEASLKSASRYNKVFSNYYKKNNIEAVLYITKDQKMMKQLVKLENTFNDTEYGKIYYSTLENVLKDKQEVIFQNRFGKCFPVFMDKIS